MVLDSEIKLPVITSDDFLPCIESAVVVDQLPTDQVAIASPSLFVKSRFLSASKVVPARLQLHLPLSSCPNGADASQRDNQAIS